MGPWWLLFGLIQIVTSIEIRLTVVSWNVNGASKFAYLPAEREFLREHDVVFLQETYSRENSLLDLSDFRSHHSLARQSTGPKPFWGLSTFFRTSSFVHGYIKREYSPCDWILVSRWTRGSAQPGIVFLNIYVPIHTSGFTPGEVSILTQCVSDLVQQYPGDKFVLGGDFNLDQARFHSQRIKPAGLKYVYDLYYGYLFILMKKISPFYFGTVSLDRALWYC
jgi:exonuclease III